MYICTYLIDSLCEYARKISEAAQPALPFQVSLLLGALGIRDTGRHVVLYLCQLLLETLEFLHTGIIGQTQYTIRMYIIGI